MKPLRKLHKAETEKGRPRKKRLSADYDLVLKQRELLHRLDSNSFKRAHGIWEAIISYANADLTADPTSDVHAPTGYEKLYRAIYDLTAQKTAVGAEFCEDGLDVTLSELPSAPSFHLLAVRYQENLRNLLLWLCEPKSHAELRVEGLKFLEFGVHGGEDWHFDYTEDPTKDFDDWHIYYLKEIKYPSILSPICKFIFDCIERVHDVGGSKVLKEVIPIIVCTRPGCGRFMLPQRTGRKEYCSVKCCGLMNKKSPREVRDYMYLYRLEKEPKGVLQRKLKTPGVKSRLHQIETRWPNLTERVKEIRARQS